MSKLATDLGAALDPTLLAPGVGIDRLDPWQERLLMSTSDRILVLKARQVGASTAVSLAALHRALYHPHSLVLIVCPAQRQAQELHHVVMANYRRLGRPVPSTGESALALQLENGSRIVALPSTENIRGYAGVSLLILDEAARVDDSVLATVRPMVAVSGGRIIALSTPAGPSGWFWRAWEGRTADDGHRPEAWQKIKVRAEDCPRLTPEFLASERAAMGSWLWKQEYGCEFIAADDALFSADDLDAVFAPVGA